MLPIESSLVLDRSMLSSEDSSVPLLVLLATRSHSMDLSKNRLSLRISILSSSSSSSGPNSFLNSSLLLLSATRSHSMTFSSFSSSSLLSRLSSSCTPNRLLNSSWSGILSEKSLVSLIPVIVVEFLFAEGTL